MDDQLHHAILQIYPQATHVIDVQSFRPGYLPYPARLTLRTVTGKTLNCVLKVSTHADTLIYEANILRALVDLQLPVPQVLAGPATIADTPTPLTIMVVSELPGHPLPWFGLTDLDAADRTCHLLHTAVEQLHALTPAVAAHTVAALVPSRTLEAEAQTIRERRSIWFDDPFFTDALNLVDATLPRYRKPLVFSNGDYNPVNFLVADDALVGWIDFEYACFEDPYIGFAKFLLWANDGGWNTGAKVGLVERFLYRHHVPPAAFLVRLLLRGLSHIQESPPEHPPHYMLQVVSDAVQRLRHELDA